MSKIIAALNMTLDGFCDHTAGIPDDTLLQHYADLLRNAGSVLYGRKTFQLMTYWQTAAAKPTGHHATDDFAAVIDLVPKLVFSRTLRKTGWASAQVTSRSLADEVLALRRQAGKDIIVGSRSLIIQLLQLHLIDEFQLCLHPVVAGAGLPLFADLNDRTAFKLVQNLAFPNGAVLLYYQPAEPATAASHA